MTLPDDLDIEKALLFFSCLNVRAAARKGWALHGAE